MSINNLQHLDEKIEYNPNAKDTNGNKKIPDGTYLMELSLGKNGCSTFSTGGKVYVQAHVEGKILAPGTPFDGWRASGFPSSLTFKGTDVSPVQQLLSRAGVTEPAETARELISLVEQTLAGHPQLYTKVRWEAKGPGADGKYVRYRGMNSFPKDSDGNPEPFVEINGEEVEAYPTIYGFASSQRQGSAA